MENKNVFIGNLDFAVTEEELKTLLSDYGTVVNIKIQKKKGCAFIEMSDEAEAALAIEKLNGTMFKDREVRISLEIKANKAKALSIKKYNERVESFSRQKIIDNPDNEPRNETDSNSVKVESHDKNSGFEDRPIHKHKKNRTAAHRPGVSLHPQRKEWSPDKPAYSKRAPRDSQKSGHGGSPEHETNYNREKFHSPDERPPRNYSRGRSDAPHPQRKVWSPDKPAYSKRAPRDSQKSGHGRSPEHETNYNREKFHSPDERPPRNYSRGRSDAPHPQRKEWSPDRPGYSSRPSGPSRQPGARTRDDSKPRSSGGSQNRYPSSSRPQSGSRGKNKSANSARPKARDGAGNRDRNNRPKRD